MKLKPGKHVGAWERERPRGRGRAPHMTDGGFRPRLAPPPAVHWHMGQLHKPASPCPQQVHGGCRRLVCRRENLLSDGLDAKRGRVLDAQEVQPLGVEAQQRRAVAY